MSARSCRSQIDTRNTKIDRFVHSSALSIFGTYNFIGGGRGNLIGTTPTSTSSYSTILGGDYNSINPGLNYATIGGGTFNIVNGSYGTVGGGTSNTAGSWATVPGGRSNTASGAYSFAAGRRAKADYDGCFVWADSMDSDFTCGAANRFRARASGGVWFFTNSTLTSGVTVAAGGNAWSSVSDRNLKDNVVEVRPEEVLEKLAKVPVTSWHYKSEPNEIRHIGPMAQDFYAAFKLGDSDRKISTIDADGVALAAIKGLHAKVSALQERNRKLREQIDTLEKAGRNERWKNLAMLFLGGFVVAGVGRRVVRGVRENG
jgi:hypothetical protein